MPQLWPLEAAKVSGDNLGSCGEDREGRRGKEWSHARGLTIMRP